jgi:DNA-binding Lrp family transcriptional regulator
MAKIRGNLSSVHHASFERLHDITNNYNQATLLDKLIFWWQISTYTLEDGHTWFTRSITQIAEDARLSERSVGRYLKVFAEAGYIEKTTRLYKKKNLYIRVTEKLLSLVGAEAKPTGPKVGESTSSFIKKSDQPDASCVFSEHVGMTGSANLAVSIYKEKDCNTSSNNTVSEPCSVNFGDKNLEDHNPTLEEQLDKPVVTESSKYPTYAVEQQIGERLPETTKNYIKGTMHNLKNQHQLVFSNPEQVFSEIVFSLLNVEQQFPGICDTHHRINLIAKLMREKKWRTPKGFYNHWDVGQTYKAQQEKQSARARYLKNKEGRRDTLYPLPEVNVSRHTQKSVFNARAQAYQELQALIATETRYLKTMEARFERKPDPMTEHVIENIGITLAGLHQKIGELKGVIQQEAA